MYAVGNKGCMLWTAPLGYLAGDMLWTTPKIYVVGDASVTHNICNVFYFTGIITAVQRVYLFASVIVS